MGVFPCLRFLLRSFVLWQVLAQSALDVAGLDSCTFVTSTLTHKQRNIPVRELPFVMPSRDSE